jgi:hypothetical protein
MAKLSTPYEIYEWSDGETHEFTILSYDDGLLTIHPRDGREPKEVKVLRLHVPESEKESYPFYWDLTSQRLVGQLRAMLPPTLLGPLKVKITAIGKPPRTHFSVSFLPERPE